HIVDTLKIEDIDDYNFSDIDALISTHTIETTQLPNDLICLEVSPLFSEEDENKIASALHHKQNPVLHQNELASIQFSVYSDKQEQVVASYVFEQAQIALDNNYAVTNDYMKSALEREKFSSTYIGNGMSMPHGDPEKVLKSHVIIFKNMQGYIWKQNKAKLVFFLAITEQDIPVMKKIIHTIAKLDENAVDQLLVLEDQSLKEKIIHLIKE
ncbi:PTS sugar transporter subunit IIA, partial [Staphylococcus shinii]